MKIQTDPNVNSVKFIDDAFAALSSVNGWGVSIANIANNASDDDLTIHVHDEDGAREQNNPTLTEYRGFAGFCHIHVFATRYETEESLKWIFLHELAHWISKQEIANCCLLDLVCQKHYKDIGVYKGETKYYVTETGFGQEYRKDEIHDTDPAEVICNMFATYVIGKEYDRKWWRENIRRVDEDDVGKS